MKSHTEQWSEMMTPEQRKVILNTYTHLMEREGRVWDGLDDCLDYLGYLDDDQLHRESDVIYEQHSRGRVKCKQDHPIEQCFVPLLVESAGIILESYKETNFMHANNRYILQYYLAFQQTGMIIFEG